MTGHLSAADIAALLGIHAPTPEQAAVIEAPLEPQLVVAGAGSGKTETMAARVVYLVANRLVEPERILGLTFTRKAAGELSERVRRRLRGLRAAQEPGQRGARSALVAPTIATYNSYAAGLVTEHALRLGVEPSARLLGEAGRWQLAHDVVQHWAADLDVDLAPSTITAAVLDLAGELAEHLVEPEALRAEVDRLVESIGRLPVVAMRATGRDLLRGVVSSLTLRSRLVDLVLELTERKRAQDTIDFADQVALAARLATQVPDVGATERDRFGVVLLDEYQDTSVAQLALLRHLFGGAGDGHGHPVTAVGDPHQSIYGWRGAGSGGLQRFGADFPLRRPDGTAQACPTLVLSTSWRNDHAVLAAANVVAGPLRAAAATAATPIDLPVLRARPGAGDGEVRTAFVETSAQEARAVAEYVATRRAALAAARTAGAVAEPVRAAVLCRKRAQFPLLHAAMIEAGLPVEVVGLGGLLSTPEVVDLVAALEAAHDPSRGDSLMRLLTGPRARLGLADLHALADWSAELSGAGPRAGRAGVGAADVADQAGIVDALDALPAPGWVSRKGRGLSEPGRARLADLGGVLRALRGQTFLPVVDLVAEAERLLGLDIEVAARPGSTPGSARVNLDAFGTVAAAFSDDGDVDTLGAFLAWLDAARREERGLDAPVGEMDPDAVQLLTVHAAKGLEWDVVAVPGLVEGTFPSGSSGSGWVKDHGALPTALRGDRDSLPDVAVTAATDTADLVARLAAFKEADDAHHRAEERRLAYVALTRARSHLLLTGSWWRDGVNPTQPSGFLLEVAAAHPGTGTEVWAPDPALAAQQGAGGRVKPVRPEPEPTEPRIWPPVHAVGEARQTRLDAAAAAVAAALGLRSGLPTPEVLDSEVLDSAGLSGVVDEVALLLEERRRGASERAAVALPAHLSASAVVRLAEDAGQFALQLRRPVPLAPSAHARRGTAFHAWVEAYFGAAALVDVDALPGADDDGAPDGLDLADLQRAFLASPWADRTPIAVEVDIETPVAGVMVRSRIDAVFPDPQGPPGRVLVVDWKTGRPPTDPQAVATRELQLAVYRLAWSRWRGVPLEDVEAAFVYVAAGTTVRPDRLRSLAEIEAVLGAPGTRLPVPTGSSPARRPGR